MSVARAKREIDMAEYVGWQAYVTIQHKDVSRAKKTRSMKPQEIGNVLKMFGAAHKAAHPGLYANA